MIGFNLHFSCICLVLLINLFGLYNQQHVANQFCETGQLDSAVRIKSGRIFIFFGSYLMEINERLSVVNQNPVLINRTFATNFRQISAAFTASGHNNPCRGLTYLIAGKNIQEFDNMKPKGSAYIDNWRSMYILRDINLVINQINDSIAVFFHIDSMFTEFAANKPSNPLLIAFVFNNVSQPSEVVIQKYVSVIALIENPIRKQKLILKAVIGLSNNKYLLFYNTLDSKPNAKGMYCITDKLKDGCQRFVDSTTICSKRLIRTTKNRIYTTRYRTKISTKHTTKRPTKRTWITPRRPTVTVTTLTVTQSVSRFTEKDTLLTTGENSQTDIAVRTEQSDNTWPIIIFLILLLYIVLAIIFSTIFFIIIKNSEKKSSLKDKQIPPKKPIKI